jgi:hypothetical protein
LSLISLLKDYPNTHFGTFYIAIIRGINDKTWFGAFVGVSYSIVQKCTVNVM